jgi:hypothetical protein
MQVASALFFPLVLACRREHRDRQPTVRPGLLSLPGGPLYASLAWANRIHILEMQEHIEG